ncbi:2062_t:CDS:2, partial [Acaulospora morrowiae]
MASKSCEEVKEEEGYYTGKQSGEETTNQKSVVEETTGQEEVSSLEVKTVEIEIPSSTIYLTVLKEVLILEEKKEFAIGEPKINMDNLIKEEQGKVAKLFETEKELFTGNLKELIQTDMIQYEIDTGDIKSIKQAPYKMAPNEYDYIRNELTKIKKQEL